MHNNLSQSPCVELSPGALLPLTALLAITIARFGWERGILGSVLFVFSVFCHESGHLVAARLSGTRVSAVGLCLHGAYNRRELARGRTEFLISAAGPAANFAIAVLLFGHPGTIGWMGDVNLALGLLNLIPLRNSDGHRMLRVIVESVRHPGQPHNPTCDSPGSSDAKLTEEPNPRRFAA